MTVSKSKLLDWIENRRDLLKSLNGDFGQCLRLKDLNSLEYLIHNGDLE